MSRRRYLAYRLLWTIVGAWGALTGIFLVFALTPDPGQYVLGGGRDAYRAARDYDEPLADRYLTWMENFATLDLGTTVHGDPIVDSLASASTVTLTYLVPSFVLAVVVGVGVGTFLAMNPNRKLLQALQGVAYAGFAIPTFVVALALFFGAAEYFSVFTLEYDRERALFTSRNLVALTLPGAALTVKVLAVQLRFARSESVDVLQEDFVQTLRATGVGTTTFAKHVLKNEASALLSLLFSELVGVVFVVLVVVEVIFNVPGYGGLFYRGIQTRDSGLILATTLFPILLIMFGNLLQDVAYSAVDPRIESEGR